MSQLTFVKWDGEKFSFLRTQTNGFHYFIATGKLATSDSETIEVDFNEYCKVMQENWKFENGLPESVGGLTKYQLVGNADTGEISIESRGSFKLEKNRVVVIESSRLLRPTMVRCHRQIKSRGRDYCFSHFYEAD